MPTDRSKTWWGKWVTAATIVLILFIGVEGVDYTLVYRFFVDFPINTALDIVIGLFWLEIWLFVSHKLAKRKPRPGWLAIAGGPITVLFESHPAVATGVVCAAGALVIYMIALINTSQPGLFRILKTLAMLLSLSAVHAAFELMLNAEIEIKHGHDRLTPVAILAAPFLGSLGMACHQRLEFMWTLEDSECEGDDYTLCDLWPTVVLKD
jgi:hypothetical protein